MATETGNGDTTLTPDDAFAVLGNETRIDILQALGDTNQPLSFSALRDRVGVSDSGQFNYHLGKLEGHFVQKTDEGYTLRHAGHRIREAVLSGAVTESVVIPLTQTDSPCPYCGGDTEMRYREERLMIRCTECVGAYADQRATSVAFGTHPEGTVTLLYLPSAAVEERTGRELLEAGHSWTYTEYVSMANGLCPRCTGKIDVSVDLCTEHRAEGGLCQSCNMRFGIVGEHRCRNCDHTKRGTFVHHLFGDPAFRAFFESRGIDPLAPGWEDLPSLYNFKEEVLDVNPFTVRFTFSAAGDELTLTVDHEFNTTATAIG